MAKNAIAILDQESGVGKTTMATHALQLTAAWDSTITSPTITLR